MWFAIISCETSTKNENAKDHLKHGAFKSVINQKHFTRQHEWVETLCNELLKPLLKKLNLSTKEFCERMNDSADPKFLCFIQDVIENSTNDIKYYFSVKK